jgi:hypothetical protein
MSGLATFEVTVPVQWLAAGHVGSPPPLTVAELIAGVPAAAAPTLTGTVITTGPFVTDAIEHPLRFIPVLGQPVITPPVAVGAALSVMPVGSVSAIVIAAVVGPFVTLIVIV